jgi:hypothetical protein
MKRRPARPARSREEPAARDELAELELKVARRADELVRAGVAISDLKLVCWLQAEQEILHRGLLANASEHLDGQSEPVSRTRA